MNEVLRYEKKFLILLDEYFQYRDYLSKFIMKDPYNQGDGYMVRSLYFDSIGDRDYLEKIYGLEMRRKIRLRIYHPSDEFASLEMKQKQGIYQKKRSLKIKREDVDLMVKGNYLPLLDYNDPLAMECYGLMNMHCYRPKTIVEYRREAYIIKENNTRITFDREIQATECCYDLFSENLNMYPVFDLFYVVIEVKYKNFLLSYLKDIFNECSRSEISMSKYILARSNIVSLL